jgi:hypothetical protein
LRLAYHIPDELQIQKPLGKLPSRFKGFAHAQAGGTALHAGGFGKQGAEIASPPPIPN